MTSQSEYIEEKLGGGDFTPPRQVNSEKVPSMPQRDMFTQSYTLT